MRSVRSILATSALAFLVAGAAQASEAEGAGSPETIVVVGRSIDAARVPGSATVIDARSLATFDHGDINRILRQAPGVNIQEEDGNGLFPNIGLRGTTVERSENVTLLEDGILIAPAPYAAPAAYYFPTAGRMAAVEVVKGAIAVRHGPRTVGGAINLRSTPIPEAPLAGLLSGRYGEHDSYEGHAWVGGSSGAFGALIETFHAGSDGFKQLDSGGNTGYRTSDYVVKLRAATPEDSAVPQSLELKLGYTDTHADETYLGLTDADFAVTPYRRYAASAEDRFDSTHKQAMLTHKAEFGGATLSTVAYLNRFKRNWRKLNDLNLGDGRGFLSPHTLFDNPAIAANALGIDILGGDVDSAAGALRVRNNNRRYESWGIQTGLSLPFETGNVAHVLDVSMRWHEDKEDRLQHDELFQMLDGDMVLTSVRPTGSNANRVAKGRGFAVFIKDTIEIGALTLVPGLRYESIELVRLDYSTSDPTRALGVTRRLENDLSVVVPALGATYDLTPEVRLLAGISRGFAPPAPGSEAREEKSWNYEAGVRYARGATQAEVIAFFNNYSNILGSCTNAVGCTTGDIGDQFNGGKVDVKGVEASASTTVALGGGLSLPLSVNYTLTDASFRQQFVSDFFGTVNIGDRLPYIPRHQLNASLGLAAAKWSVTLSANHVSAVRTEAGRGTIPQSEKVGARTVFDLAASYWLTDGLKLFGRVDNLFDNEYEVARRPLGLRPGKPQTIIGGLSYQF